MKRLGFALAVTALAVVGLARCGAQQPDEVAVTFRAAFKAEAGVSTEVVFPFPSDALADAIAQGLEVTDGGTAEVKDTTEGRGLSLVGKGEISATFTAKKLKGLGSDKGIPQTGLTRLVPDAGTNSYYVRVNKGGTPLATTDFAYEVSKDCGPECGGNRKFSYAGPVGLALHVVEMTFSEAKQ